MHAKVAALRRAKQVARERLLEEKRQAAERTKAKLAEESQRHQANTSVARRDKKQLHDQVKAWKISSIADPNDW